MLRKSIGIGVLGVVIIGACSLLALKPKTSKQEVVGGFVAGERAFDLVLSHDPNEGVKISLLDRETSKPHARSDWLVPKQDLKFACSQYNDCVIVAEFDTQTRIASGLKLQQRALTRPLSAQQIASNKSFGFVEHTYGVAKKKKIEKVIRKFAPSQDSVLTENGLRS